MRSIFKIQDSRFKIKNSQFNGIKNSEFNGIKNSEFKGIKNSELRIQDSKYKLDVCSKFRVRNSEFRIRNW